MKMEIRLAKKSDLEEINKLYNYYITHTAFTFDTKKKTLSEITSWYDKFGETKNSICLVAYVNNKLIGFACSTSFRKKEAYKRSVETSVYINVKNRGKGFGKKLMTKLIKKLQLTETKSLYALITYPNQTSINLHKSLNYKKVGQLNDVGFKFNKYWSVYIYELKL